jgi:serine/threonine protein kinase
MNEEVWDTLSDAPKNLIHRMLDKNPARRITLRDALAHPWFANIERTQSIMDKFFTNELYYQRGYTFSNFKNSSRLITPITLNGKVVAADEHNVIYSSFNMLNSSVSRTLEDATILTTARPGMDVDASLSNLTKVDEHSSTD